VFSEEIPFLKDQVCTVLQMKNLPFWDSTKLPMISYRTKHIVPKNCAYHLSIFSPIH